MSYILDALRRAEADRERERGRVPGLHTQPLSSSEAAPAAAHRRWLPWAGAGLLLLAGIGAGSWWAGGQQEAPSALAPPVPPPAPTPQLRQPTEVATAPVPAPPAPAATQPVSSAPAPQPAASASPYLPPAPPPGAVAAAPVAPAPRPGGAATPAPAPVVAATPVPVPAVPPAPAPTPVAEAPIPRLAELPESMRHELPRLVISGSVYSDDPASRFVIVNGQVLREGARLSADLVLEQIGQRELVLRFKGQRFRQPV
ncbi:MAG: general secretion pathway protein GspB [Burkholderiales bacterium]|nr:general secretion pathway protein GspB [Burkholderiales bacterium]